MYCVETKNLSYKFSPQETVLNNINLQVPQGAIYGFLGPNGAGKTTTLRLLLGLLKKQEGVINVFEKPFENNRIEILKNTGSLIESPSLYGHLTAVENLAVLQKIYQCPKERIGEVLQLVDLHNTGNKKARQFSLGMKQRLGIAMAMLNDPSLLILDEPTNGLDPNGIIEIRELLKKINAEKDISIIISSHLLAEIEKLVTHVGIINNGSMMFQGTLNDLTSKQQQSSCIIFKTSDLEKTILLMNGLSPQIKNGMVEIRAIGKEAIAKLNKRLVEEGIEVYEITTVKNDLEAIFMNLINN